MVNRVGTGDVDAQWFWRASNPHPPDRCGRSAMLSYGTASQPYGAPDRGHTHGLGRWDGHPATPAPSAQPVCVVARHRDRPRVHGAHADCLDSPRAFCRSNRIRTGDLPLRRRTLYPLSYGTWWLFHSDVLCVPERESRRIGGTRTRDLPAPGRRATDCATIRRGVSPDRRGRHALTGAV